MSILISSSDKVETNVSSKVSQTKEAKVVNVGNTIVDDLNRLIR